MNRLVEWFEARSLTPAAWMKRGRRWMRSSGPFWLTSAVVHVATVGIVFSWTINEMMPERAPEKAPLNTEVEPEIAYYQIGTPSMRVSQLSTETLAMVTAPAQTEKQFDQATVYEDGGGGSRTVADGPILGGFGGFLIADNDDLGGAPVGLGGVGIGLGAEGKAGHGGHGEGFGGGGRGHREKLAGPEADESTERAVAAALNWLHRHQLSDGNWSLTEFSHRCQDEACSGAGHLEADTAATSLALMPFLAAEQTPNAKGPYRRTIERGLNWLLQHQQPSGDLSGGADQLMYAHAIGTIVVCEAFRLTKDERLAAAAQRAVHFIEVSQNPLTGGWQFQPGEEGDTFSTGWQIMALNSAQVAGIGVAPECLMRAANWFQRVSHGERGGLISYVPEHPESMNMTAIGLLARQYLGTERDAPPMVEAVQYLKQHAIDETTLGRDLIGSYFLTCALDAYQPSGTSWEGWSEHVRRALLATQSRTGCAAGSWYSEEATEIWTMQGGRLFSTSLAALTLTVSYRHLSIYRTIQAFTPQIAEQPQSRGALIRK
jgi:hypothetical protein